MDSIPALVRLFAGALLFDGDAYRKMKGRSRPATDGAWLLLFLGAGLGLAETAGALLTWATSPALSEVQGLVAGSLGALPLLGYLGLEAPDLAGMAAGQGWLFWAVHWLRPTPLFALWRLLAAPLALLLAWLGYGTLAHLFARRLGGGGSLVETLGCTALAEAPLTLLWVPLLPPLGLARAGIGCWVLAARFRALGVAHGLQGWRAFWATLLPTLFLGGLAALPLLICTLAGGPL